MDKVKERLKEIFETTVESGLKYEGSHKNPEYYKGLLTDFNELSHITIEVNECKEESCPVPKNKT